MTQIDRLIAIVEAWEPPTPIRLLDVSCRVETSQAIVATCVLILGRDHQRKILYHRTEIDPSLIELSDVELRELVHGLLGSSLKERLGEA